MSFFRNRIKVTLFDEFGEKVEELFNKVQEEEIFIILSCGKVGRYEGNICFKCITSFFITLAQENFSCCTNWFSNRFTMCN